ncbi:MAG: hypothetical protein GY865_01325 [candidate division Zixibacteria bacterium]|nr:hypothetical protein [candidate division Zixibacteria bacterium]
MKRFTVLFGLLILLGSLVPVSAFGFGAEIEDVPVSLTTIHNIPFDETFSITNPASDPITSIGAVDENDNPIGTITYTPEELSFQWTYDPSCAWVTDGLTHTVNFYLEDETSGHLYPEVTLYTSTLIVTAGEAPEFSGSCGSYLIGTIGHTTIAEFEVTNQSEEDIYWSYFVLPYSPSPVGNVELIDGVLSYSPCPWDETIGFFTFTVYATDCAGQYDACDVTIEIVSCCPNHYHDPNNDDAIDILDIVLLINNVYKDGPAPAYPPSGDWNLDYTIDILDIVYIINFVYKDGYYAKHDYSTCAGYTSPVRGGCK